MALLAPLAWLVLVADGWTVNRLVVRLWVDARDWGFGGSPEDFGELLNAAMLVPSALLAALFAPRVPWWVWGAVGMAGSAGIEAAQFYLIERDASLGDFALNTLGAFLGAGLGELINRRRERS
jgi:glycopeptide antibiotics resistance protein